MAHYFLTYSADPCGEQFDAPDGLLGRLDELKIEVVYEAYFEPLIILHMPEEKARVVQSLEGVLNLERF